MRNLNETNIFVLAASTVQVTLTSTDFNCRKELAHSSQVPLGN